MIEKLGLAASLGNQYTDYALRTGLINRLWLLLRRGLFEQITEVRFIKFLALPFKLFKILNWVSNFDLTESLKVDQGFDNLFGHYQSLMSFMICFYHVF